VNAFFTPFSIGVGLAAGQLAKKAFQAIWGRFADADAPKPKHREVVFVQLLIALIVEGAVTRVVRGLVDHGSRHAWRTATGAWPGAESPDDEEE
jgi:hypothetical protein